MKNVLKIGTRGSPLALTQANMVKRELSAKFPSITYEIEIIKTSGDWKPEDGEVRLSESEGGKGQFAKEIEAALLNNKIDLAVHSMKDMDSHLPDGLCLDFMLPRQDARDCLIIGPAYRGFLANFSQLNERFLEDKTIGCWSEILPHLPHGVRVGTASVRRAAYIKNQKPDCKILPFRGNVQTRLDKLAAGDVDITFLAMAGLNRLGLADQADIILSEDVMLPAAGQGAVGIEIRSSDQWLAKLLLEISCEKTVLCVKAERAVLKVLDGTCHTPISAFATLKSPYKMNLSAVVLSEDGSQRFEVQNQRDVQTIEEAENFGTEVGFALKKRVPNGVLA